MAADSGESDIETVGSDDIAPYIQSQITLELVQDETRWIKLVWQLLSRSEHFDRHKIMYWHCDRWYVYSRIVLEQLLQTQRLTFDRVRSNGFRYFFRCQYPVFVCGHGCRDRAHGKGPPRYEASHEQTYDSCGNVILSRQIQTHEPD